jgi:hypothetical protein
MGYNLGWLLWHVFGRNPQRKRRGSFRRGPIRDWKYRAWVRTLPCAACGSEWQIEAAHTGSDGGMSQKASDHSCVPLCRNCHTVGPNAYHRIGKREFERRHGLQLASLVRRLNRAWFRCAGMVK